MRAQKLKMSFAVAAVSAALTGAAVRPVQAEILAFATNVNPQIAAGLIPRDLNGPAPGTDVTFATPVPSLVEITFSAECAINGTPVQSGTIEIQVDPAGPGGFATIAPTLGPDDRFCSGDAVAGITQWVTPSMTVVTRVPAGVHVARVLFTPTFGATAMWLDDSSITIDR